MIHIFSYDLDHTYSNNLHNRISQVRLGQFCRPYLKQKICIYSSSHWVSAAYIISSVSRSVLNPFIGEWPIHGNAVIYTAILVVWPSYLHSLLRIICCDIGYIQKVYNLRSDRHQARGSKSSACNYHLIFVIASNEYYFIT